MKQERDEAFDVYYKRFKTLVSSCPNHGIRDGLLLQYFYEGLLPMERQFLDSAAGGALMEKSKEDVTDRSIKCDIISILLSLICALLSLFRVR